MPNSKITKIYEAFSEEDANDYLGYGWVIVAVVSGTRPYVDREEVGPVYVLGWPEGNGDGNEKFEQRGFT